MTKILSAVLTVVGFLVTLVALSAFLALPTKWLWNGLIPDLFKGPEITFFQAWGLNLLASSILGGSVSK